MSALARSGRLTALALSLALGFSAALTAGCGTSGGAAAIASGGVRPGWNDRPSSDPRYPIERFVTARAAMSSKGVSEGDAGGEAGRRRARGGRLQGKVRTGPDGRAQVRVDDVGHFDTPEKSINVTLDWWGALANGGAAPAWTRTLPEIAAATTALKKTKESTRVIVRINEQIMMSEAGGDPRDVTEPPVARPRPSVRASPTGPGAARSRRCRRRWGPSWRPGSSRFLGRHSRRRWGTGFTKVPAIGAIATSYFRALRTGPAVGPAERRGGTQRARRSTASASITRTT